MLYNFLKLQLEYIKDKILYCRKITNFTFPATEKKK